MPPGWSVRSLFPSFPSVWAIDRINWSFLLPSLPGAVLTFALRGWLEGETEAGPVPGMPPALVRSWVPGLLTAGGVERGRGQDPRTCIPKSEFGICFELAFNPPHS